MKFHGIKRLPGAGVVHLQLGVDKITILALLIWGGRLAFLYLFFVAPARKIRGVSPKTQPVAAR